MIKVAETQQFASRFFFLGIHLAAPCLVLSPFFTPQTPMEVLRDNFHTELPYIKEAIDECEFIAIDAEFSGTESWIKCLTLIRGLNQADPCLLTIEKGQSLQLTLQLPLRHRPPYGTQQTKHQHDA